ncbi:DUF222 domain-containing protein, partial [uncultured Jatrophihabitans sp.]|uniref:DUF222 domain-containing protein n=1 Tax=uncultured Jatrophihabitans sp. TaxID=1610747 RepID=UPI0035CC043D
MTRAVRDFTSVGQARRLRVLATIRRRRCELDALEVDVLAAMAADPDPYRDGAPDLGKQWVREDVACALRIPSSTAGYKLALATEVTTRFPTTLQAMRDARISGHYAERLVEATTDLPTTAATKVETRVLERADTQTLAQFGRTLQRAVASVDTRATEAKHAAARAQRRVVFAPADDGMVEQWALLPAEQAAAMQAAVNALADSWKGLDERTADQRRADALVKLTTDAGTRKGSQGGARVNVTVALSTLLFLDDQPGALDGHGTIPASIAR